MIADELIKLEKDGFGKFISKDKMHTDGILPFNQCANVFLKPDMSVLDNSLIEMSSDKEITRATYASFFSKPMDENQKKIIGKYHRHRRLIFMSQDVDPSLCKFPFKSSI